MEILSKDMIHQWILPHIVVGKRGFKPKVSVIQVVRIIFYKLKTGCQWRLLPLDSFFKEEPITWQGVYYHFREWVKNGTWQNIWLNILQKNRNHLDLSSLQLDGSHTPAKRGGEAVAYQGRKSAKTTTISFICDKKGNMLAMATPQAGNHNDMFNIKALFGELCEMLKKANIDLNGLFLNADAGFDCVALRQACAENGIEANIAVNPRNSKKEKTTTKYQHFDEELYKERTVIEHANAWMDSFKTLLVRFETRIDTWISFILMAFSIRFLNKNKCK